ncbi:MAG: PAS domain S-box protein [Nitrospinae bacterium]|nr:PAS domain S-box protein [Nitrospinota bacterium]
MLEKPSIQKMELPDRAILTMGGLSVVLAGVLAWWLLNESQFDRVSADYRAVRWLILFAFSIVLALFLAFSALSIRANRRTKKLAQEFHKNETKLRAVMDTAVDGMIMINRRGIVQSFNHAAERIFHYSADEVLGHSVNMLMPEPYAGEHDGYMERYLRSGDPRIIGIGREVTAKRKDGSIFPMDLAVSEVRHGEEIGFLGIARDITVRKQMETALLAAREKLEIRVENRTRELMAANEELKNFAYIVSHDLRSPLVNLKGFAGELSQCLESIRPSLERVPQLLGEEEGGKFSAAFEQEIPEALAFINSSVARMDRLISAVLRLSRIGRREFDVQPVNMEDLVNKIFESLTHQIQQRSVQVAVGALPEMMGDPIALEQIFGNLLANSILYLEDGRPGKVEVGAESNGNEYVFHVRDNGRGIAREDMGRIFDIFRRAGRQDVPGEGMGLAYVKTLVHRHGGRIWCESELGSGTTFFVALPRLIKTEETE